jgi:Recombinase zinc beta ribbon domain
MKNPVYCGLIVHKGQTFKGNFPALVSDDLWHSVQDALRGKKKAVPKKTVDESFPLRGFVKCGYCRAKLTAGNARGRSKTYAQYWCWNKQCSKPVSVDRQKLEVDWLGFLEHMQPAFDALVNVLPILAKANAKKRIEDAEQRQRHLATHFQRRNHSAIHSLNQSCVAN